MPRSKTKKTMTNKEICATLTKEGPTALPPKILAKILKDRACPECGRFCPGWAD